MSNCTCDDCRARRDAIAFTDRVRPEEADPAQALKVTEWLRTFCKLNRPDLHSYEGALADFRSDLETLIENQRKERSEREVEMAYERGAR